ncbi:MAG TPA: nicotinate-nucleotide--dimethylbenzimidazole phosphoribosyltransferase [Terriglobales bacterium]|nr:nicotinate-nucleotide--dimethylbenzimidazole phosphoribosyltransferase [Terriglobales bacterium]
MEAELKPAVELSAAVERTIAEIRGIDERYREKAQRHLDSLTKPLGSLGQLEAVAAQYVAWREEEVPKVTGKAVFVFAGDHGITDEGVSAYPREVTPQMVRNFLNGGAAINVLARHTNSDIVVVDVGVDADFDGAPGLLRRKVRRGTRNFAREAAMTDAELNAALEVGIELATEAAAQGRSLIALGEMGIGNTSAATAITAALSGKPVSALTGRGTGLDAPRCVRKAQIIDNALHLHFGDSTSRPDPLDVLRCVGGLEIAAITGAVLGAAAKRIAVVIDGFICTAGAAIACAIAPDARFGIIAGHLSQEPGHRVLLEAMGVKPVLQLDMRLGEGTGAVLTFPLIESAIRIYNEMATFDSAGVSEASEA